MAAWKFGIGATEIEFLQLSFNAGASGYYFCSNWEYIYYKNLAELLLSTSTKAAPSDPLQRVFNLYEQEVSPLMNKLDSVSQKVNGFGMSSLPGGHF